MKIIDSYIGECDLCKEEGELIEGVCNKYECQQRKGKTAQHLPEKVTAALKRKFRRKK
jgi:hypothetical protein